MIELDFSSNPEILENATNINVDIFRVDVKRNNFAMGFGEHPIPVNHKLAIRKDIPEQFSEGLYVASGLRLFYGENGEQVKKIQIEDINTVFFWISKCEELSALELSQKISQIDLERSQYINADIKTASFQEKNEGRNYRAIVFSVGCLLHSPQLMQGYIIHPLGHGFSYIHMHEAVKKFINFHFGWKLNESEVIESSFAESTPLFAIDFHSVYATDHEDAGIHCTNFSENIFTVLAYDRGQRPHSFATIIFDSVTREIWQAFHFPGYKGNLISDFNPSSTANSLDNLLPKLEASSWIDLIMRIYADAKNEQNRDYAFLKYWQILEMIAKKYIPSNTDQITKPDGSLILDRKGVPITTKYALGKVYKFVFDLGVPMSSSQSSEGGKLIFESFKAAALNPNYDVTTKVVTLWDVLCSVYEIRNATAHSGEFNIDLARCGEDKARKAAELLDIQHGTFESYVQSMIRTVVSKELRKA